MKRWLAFLPFLLVASFWASTLLNTPAQDARRRPITSSAAAPSVVSSVHNNSGDNGSVAGTTVISNAVTAATGDTLVVGIGGTSDGTQFTASDSVAGSLTCTTASFDGGSGRQAQFCYKANVASGGHTVTGTYSLGSSDNLQMSVWVLRGTSTTTPLDQVANNSGSSAGGIDSAGTITTTAANEVILVWTTSNPAAVFTAQSGFTTVAATTGRESKHKVVTSIQTAYSVPIQTDTGYFFVAQVATFK